MRIIFCYPDGETVVGRTGWRTNLMTLGVPLLQPQMTEHGTRRTGKENGMGEREREGMSNIKKPEIRANGGG